jgi:soluble lytic murein transglycosylase-like protein
MSRTYRDKGHNFFYTRDWVLHDYNANGDRIRIDPKSKEGRKRLAKQRADKTMTWKEPGPAWFRNLTTERPQRRKAKAQLYRYVRGEEFEVMLEAKAPRDYWL